VFWIKSKADKKMISKYKETFEAREKAAQQGDADAQYALGAMYFKEQNYKEAFNWYKKSAEQGNAAAKTLLTKLLESK
jgi:TPR repeat protein